VPYVAREVLTESDGEDGVAPNWTTSALCTPRTCRKFPFNGVTICGASFKNELVVDSTDAREDTPDTPERVLLVYGVFGGSKKEEGASEAGRDRSSLMSIFGPRCGRIGVPG